MCEGNLGDPDEREIEEQFLDWAALQTNSEK